MKVTKEITVLLGICVLMIIFGKTLPRYYLSLFFLIYMAVCLSQSWNLLAGYTGYLSFGHGAFFGVGAYASAILITKLNIHWILGSILGGIAGFGISMTLGLPLIILLRGAYFAISMFGLLTSLRVLASYWESLTGGAFGISISPDVALEDCYYAMGFLALITCYAIYKLVNSRYGYRIIAIREDELCANVTGIDTEKYKMLSFGLSAFFTGVAGGIFAWHQSFIDPDSAFDLMINVQIVAIVIFGGMGTISGPIIGGIMLLLFSEIMWTYFPHIHQVIFGLLIILIIMFLPEGIITFRGYLPKVKSWLIS